MYEDAVIMGIDNKK